MKVRPQKVVVYIERLPTGAQLVIKNQYGGIIRLDCDRLGPSLLGARWKVLVGDPATIVGSEPVYDDPTVKG
jgi:hypothetical protein